MKYYVKLMGRAFGPYEHAEVEKLVKSGRISADTEISARTKSDWKPASAFPEFFGGATYGGYSGAPQGNEWGGSGTESILAPDNSAPGNSASGIDPADQEIWTLCFDGKTQIGPLPARSIANHVLAGNLSRSALVWRAGERPREVGTVPEFARLLGEDVGAASSDGLTLVEEGPASSGETPEWFYSVDGVSGYGPYPVSEIVRLFRDGKIQLESVVWREGENARHLRREPVFIQALSLNAAPGGSSAAPTPAPEPARAPDPKPAAESESEPEDEPEPGTLAEAFERGRARRPASWAVGRDTSGSVPERRAYMGTRTPAGVFLRGMEISWMIGLAGLAILAVVLLIKMLIFRAGGGWFGQEFFGLGDNFVTLAGGLCLFFLIAFVFAFTITIPREDRKLNAYLAASVLLVPLANLFWVFYAFYAGASGADAVIKRYAAPGARTEYITTRGQAFLPFFLSLIFAITEFALLCVFVHRIMPLWLDRVFLWSCILAGPPVFFEIAEEYRDACVEIDFQLKSGR